MSEYQYYEFRALDRPLSKSAQAELRSCSSRATITASRFVNQYHWGDLKADPDEWMRRYFDAHLYYANWGSNSLMLRLPVSGLDKVLLDEFVRPPLSDASSGYEAALAIRCSEQHLILVWRFNDDSGYCDRFCEGDGQEWLERLLPLRDELLAGDTRPLYLGWLARVGAGELGGSDIEPPLPAGLASLTSAQQALVDFLQLDPDWLAAAAQVSPAVLTSASDREAEALWLAEQPYEALRASVALLLAGRIQEAQQGVRQAYLTWQKTRSSPSTISLQRSVAQIGSGLKRARQQRLVREKEVQVALAARQKAIREAHLVELAARQEQVWLQIDAALQKGSGVGYDHALQLLIELSEALKLVGREAQYRVGLTNLMSVHGARKAWLARLQRAGLLLD